MNRLSCSSTMDTDVFRLAFANSPIGMALVGKNGEWLDVNESVCRITGYTREELLQITFQDITHPDDLEKDLSLLNQMLKDEIVQYEMKKRYFHKQGHLVWIQLNVSVVRDADEKPLFFISQIQDITDKVTLENQLRQRESELRSILNHGQINIVRFDREHRHLYVNYFVENEIGRAAVQIIGKTFADFGINDASSKLIESSIESVFRKKQPVQIELENFISPESRYFLARLSPEFDSRGEVETVLFVSLNATDLKNTELELREALAQVKQLQAFLPICSYCRNIRDDQDYWHTVENYISAHTDSKFSHSICPNCYESEVKPQLETLKKTSN